MYILNNNHRKYLMNNIEFEDFDNFKDLGILYTDKRKFNNHINNICNKACIIINIIFQ